MYIGVEFLVKNRIIEQGRGWCFTSMHFSDLGADASIRKALSHFQKQNIIQRLAKGIYDYPKMQDLLGLLFLKLGSLQYEKGRKIVLRNPYQSVMNAIEAETKERSSYTKDTKNKKQIIVIILNI